MERKQETILGPLSKKQIDSLLRVGQQMSNWCFNVKQIGSRFPPVKIRSVAAQMQADWDKAKREV